MVLGGFLAAFVHVELLSFSPFVYLKGTNPSREAEISDESQGSAPSTSARTSFSQTHRWTYAAGCSGDRGGDTRCFIYHRFQIHLDSPGPFAVSSFEPPSKFQMQQTWKGQLGGSFLRLVTVYPHVLSNVYSGNKTLWTSQNYLLIQRAW